MRTAKVAPTVHDPRQTRPRARLAVALIGAAAAATWLASGTSSDATEEPAPTAAWSVHRPPILARLFPGRLWAAAEVDLGALGRGLSWLGGLGRPEVERTVVRAVAVLQREACLASLTAEARWAAMESPGVCPSGGLRTRDLDAAPACTIHGSPAHPRDEPPARAHGEARGGSRVRRHPVSAGPPGEGDTSPTSLRALAAELPSRGRCWLLGAWPRGAAPVALALTGPRVAERMDSLLERITGQGVDAVALARRAGLAAWRARDAILLLPARSPGPRPQISLESATAESTTQATLARDSTSIRAGQPSGAVAPVSATELADLSELSGAALPSSSPLDQGGCLLRLEVDLGEASGRGRWPRELAPAVSARVEVGTTRATLVVRQADEAAAEGLERRLQEQTAYMKMGGPLARLAGFVKGQGASWLLTVVEHLTVSRSGREVILSVIDLEDTAPLVAVALAGAVALAQDTSSYDPAIAACAHARALASTAALAWMASEGVPPPASPSRLRELGYVQELPACPGEGTLLIAPDGLVTCTVHGSTSAH